MNFRVGQKVVCVDASITGVHCGRPEYELTEDGIYIIRWIGRGIYRLGEFDGVRVEGVVRARRLRDLMDDLPFGAHRFRPIVERKTNIAVFTAMLTPNKRELVHDDAK